MVGGFVLALDQGTTGSTALVVDVTGAVRARGYAEVPQHYPRPGWVEHDPEDLWTTVERAATQALKTAGITGDDVAAIGITNQRAPTATRRWCASAPASCSTPTSRGRRSRGSSIRCPTRAAAPRAASWPSVPSTRGCCGS